MHNKTLHTIFFFVAMTISNCGTNAQPTYAVHSKLASGSWYKIAVNTDGVYKLTAADVAGLSGISCERIAMYGSAGDQLSEDNRVRRTDDMEPIAIEIVDKNGNGLFENGDCILFYGEGPNVWRFNNRSQQFEYKPHAYATENFYYLTTSADKMDSSLRIQTSNQHHTSSSAITSYTATAIYHPDNINTHGGGQIWVADKFGSGISSRSYSLQLPALPTDNTISLRYGLANVSDYGAQFSITVSDSSLQKYIPPTTVYQTYTDTWHNIRDNVSVKINYSPQAAMAEGYLDFLELTAQVGLRFVSQNGQQFFRNSQQIGDGVIGQFAASGYRSDLKIWDVTNPNQPSNLTITPGSGENFSFDASCQNAGTFLAFLETDAMRPLSVTPLANQDIHGAETPDYVIVTHHDFLTQAEELANLHRNEDGMSVMVVEQDLVYNEFSSGKQDPIALRQMMRCLRAKDADGIKPKYLLLFGKGTYDNRDILGNHHRSVVTYQTPSSFDSEGSAFPSDDIAGYLEDNIGGPFEGRMSVGIGRLPAKTAAEADHFVSKIRNYILRHDFENENIRGDWRNYVTLLADDADPSCPYDTSFASDSEKMSRLIKASYPHLNIDKIFADSYIQQSGADGSYYPDVNNALRQRMNYGCLLFNYIGHGSSSYIGTERFMEFTDIEKYSNTDRLPLFVTSTCSFGHYDLTEGVCGAEAILLADNAGIGVISAARPIHHNYQFNTNTCMFALDPENTIGDALRKAKNQTTVSHCISLLGDPALHLSIPRNRVVVTSVNNHEVEPDVTDSAEVLSRVTIAGEIRNEEGRIVTDFNGTIYPIVFDREVACRTLANDNDSSEVDFTQQKNMLYKGRETVENGRFTYSFVIPKDVAYRYDYAKLSHYAKSANDNATGAYCNIMFGGFNENSTIEEVHPTVRLFIGDTNFRNGGLTNETPTLYARLIDSVGINAAGSGLGHDITAVIDGNPYSTITLNDYYEPSISDSRNGEVYYTLGKLDNGRHTLTLKCWNIYNYSGSSTISFVVANDRTAQLGQLSATPNPAHDRTLIRLEHNLSSNIAEATISIYDMRGALVKEFKPALASSTSVVAFPWDFRAENGSQVSKGIYIVRGTIITADGEKLTQTSKIVKN